LTLDELHGAEVSSLDYHESWSPCRPLSSPSAGLHCPKNDVRKTFKSFAVVMVFV